MPDASALEEFGLEVEHENHALVTNSGSSSADTTFASFSNSKRRPTTPSKVQRSLLASTNVKYSRLRVSAIQRPGVLKWSLIVIIFAAVIVFFNIGQEETMEEAITPEDTEAKSDSKAYQLLRPKVKVHQDDAASVEVVDDKREKVEEKVDTNKQEEKDSNESLAHSQPLTVDDNIDSSETQEKKEETTKVEETTTDKNLEPFAPDKDEHEKSNEKPNDGSFTIERLKATREAAQNLVSMLQEYYGGKDQSKKMMLESWLLPWEFDPQTNDTDKVVMKEKLVDTMARALVTEDQKEFIIGTIGSSVAAGHDNCNFDSWERQMERTFGPVWEAAGMKLVCQNSGEGGGCGDDFANQVFCIKQNVSPNIDIAQ
jgi:hypothetical protein